MSRTSSLNVYKASQKVYSSAQTSNQIIVTAQDRGWTDRFLEWSNFGGKRLENKTQIFGVMMGQLRQADNLVRATLLGKKYGDQIPYAGEVSAKDLLESAKKNYENKEYLVSISYLEQFYQKVLYCAQVLKNVSEINKNLNAEYFKALAEDLTDDQKRRIYNYLIEQKNEQYLSPEVREEIKRMKEQNAKDLAALSSINYNMRKQAQFHKTAGLIDWVKELFDSRLSALNLWERIQPGAGKQLSRDIRTVLSASDRLLNNFQTNLNKMSEARAGRKIADYDRFSQDLVNKVTNYSGTITNANFNKHTDSLNKILEQMATPAQAQAAKDNSNVAQPTPQLAAQVENPTNTSAPAANAPQQQQLQQQQAQAAADPATPPPAAAIPNDAKGLIGKFFRGVINGIRGLFTVKSVDNNQATVENKENGQEQVVPVAQIPLEAADAQVIVENGGVNLPPPRQPSVPAAPEAAGGEAAGGEAGVGEEAGVGGEAGGGSDGEAGGASPAEPASPEGNPTGDAPAPVDETNMTEVELDLGSQVEVLGARSNIGRIKIKYNKLDLNKNAGMFTTCNIKSINAEINGVTLEQLNSIKNRFDKESGIPDTLPEKGAKLIINLTFSSYPIRIVVGKLRRALKERKIILENIDIFSGGDLTGVNVKVQMQNEYLIVTLSSDVEISTKGKEPEKEIDESQLESEIPIYNIDSDVEINKSDVVNHRIEIFGFNEYGENISKQLFDKYQSKIPDRIPVKVAAVDLKTYDIGKYYLTYTLPDDLENIEKDDKGRVITFKANGNKILTNPEKKIPIALYKQNKDNQNKQSNFIYTLEALSHESPIIVSSFMKKYARLTNNKHLSQKLMKISKRIM
jgi:hypothetical protein